MNEPNRRSRWRGALNTDTTTSMVRIGSYNVGRKRGWQDGIQTALTQDQLDVMFILDTGHQTSQRILFRNLVGEAWMEENRGSSMIVVAGNPDRWKVVEQWTAEEGCYIKITDGRNRIAGVYLRPNKNTNIMTTVTEKLAGWIQATGLLIGDFNGRSRRMDTRTNQRGTRLIQLADKYNLTILATEEPTFVTRGGRSGGGSSKVDLGIVKGWSATIKILKNDWMVTDHHGIIVEGERMMGITENVEEEDGIRNRLPRAWRCSQGETLEGMEEALRNELRMRIADRNQTNQDVLSTTLLENMKIQPRLKKRRPIDRVCKDLEANYLEARRIYQNDISEENRQRLQQAGKAKMQAIRKLRRRLFAEKRTDLEGLTPAEFAAAVKNLRKWQPKMEVRASKSDFIELLKEKMGSINTRREALQSWEPNSQRRWKWMEALEEKIGKIPNGKAVGEDGVSFELLKQFPNLTKEAMDTMIVRMFQNGIPPEGWERSITIMLPKKDPLSMDAKDFRPVALQSHARKLLEHCLADEIGKQVMNMGIIAYSRRMGTEIALVLLKEQLRMNNDLRVICLDLKGAYDRVPLTPLMDKIDLLQVHEEVKQILKILVNCNMKVVVGKREFWTAKGIAQGGVISPGLWNLHILPLAETLQELFTPKIGRVRPVMIYCDDCLLIIDRRDMEVAQRILDACTQWAAESESLWEMGKSHVVMESDMKRGLVLQAEELGVSKEKRYLGMYITPTGIDVIKNLEVRIEKAEKQLRELERMGVLGRRLSIANRVRIFKTFVRPHLEYGLIAMDMTDEQWERLESTQVRMLAELLKVTPHNVRMLRAVTRITTMRQRREERRNTIRFKLTREEDEENNDEDLGAQTTITELREDLREVGSILAQELDEEELERTASKTKRLDHRVQELHNFCIGWKNRPPTTREIPWQLKTNDQNVGKWVLNQYMNRGITRAGNWRALEVQIAGLKAEIFGLIYKEEENKEEDDMKRMNTAVRQLKRWLNYRNRRHGGRLTEEARLRRQRRQRGEINRGERDEEDVEEEIEEGELRWIRTGRRMPMGNETEVTGDDSAVEEAWDTV